MKTDHLFLFGVWTSLPKKSVLAPENQTFQVVIGGFSGHPYMKKYAAKSQ